MQNLLAANELGKLTNKSFVQKAKSQKYEISYTGLSR